MASGSSPRTAFKRLLKELEAWKIEAEEETGIERLGPPKDDDLLTWEAVINGRGVGSGYDGSSHLIPFASCAPCTLDWAPRLTRNP